MFFVGLVLSIPELYFDRDIFPGTWHCYTLHVQAIVNGMMLMIVALLLPLIGLNSFFHGFLEVAINVGAWFNVIPWFYGARTGAVLVMGAFHRSAPPSSVMPPLNNDFYVETMVVGDIVGFAIIIAALCQPEVVL